MLPTQRQGRTHPFSKKGSNPGKEGGFQPYVPNEKAVIV